MTDTTTPNAQLSADTLSVLLGWVNVLNQQVPAGSVVDPEVVVERCGWEPGRRHVLERIVGVDAVTAWAARNLGGARFELETEPPFSVLPGQIVARYRVVWGDYVNGGVWYARIRDGRLLYLRHAPDDVPVIWQKGPPPGMSLPG